MREPFGYIVFFHLLLFLQAKQSLATLTKDVPKRHSLAMPGETVLNGNQEWVVQADLPLTAAIRQSQQTLYHSHPPHPADRQGESCLAWASNKGGVKEEATGLSGKSSFFVHITAAWGSTGQTVMTSLTEPTKRWPSGIAGSRGSTVPKT